MLVVKSSLLVAYNGRISIQCNVDSINFVAMQLKVYSAVCEGNNSSQLQSPIVFLSSLNI